MANPEAVEAVTHKCAAATRGGQQSIDDRPPYGRRVCPAIGVLCGAALVGEFERLEIELFKLRHRIEARHAA